MGGSLVIFLLVIMAPFFASIALRVVIKICSLLRRRQDIREFGEYALVTGATDGIGRAFVLEIARRNMSIILVGRDSQKLMEVNNTIKSYKEFTKEVIVIQFDFQRPTDIEYEKLEKEVQKYEIGLIINNVGLSYESALYYHEISSSLINDLIEVNLRSCMRMTHMVYKGMCQRRKGAIVCISSGAAVLPTEPLYAAYAGAKGGVEAFCRSLQAECAPFHVIVQCQVPLLVASKMSKIRKESLAVPSPAKYAQHGIKAIEHAQVSGILKTPTTVSPYPVHDIILKIAQHIPVFLWDRIRLRQTADIRRRYLLKMRKNANSTSNDEVLAATSAVASQNNIKQD